MSIYLNGYKITPTIFPDKTSQVWHLPAEWIKPYDNVIRWEFEREDEFLHVAQLKTLVSKGVDTTLELPYFPYARQDKDVSNDATFALHTFCKLLNSLKFKQVRSIDVHNPRLVGELLYGFVNELADEYITSVEYALHYLVAKVAPDQGAALRYNHHFVCHKERCPDNGNITTLEMEGNVENKELLIVDDICDGGATFIKLAKFLYSAGAKRVHLYVTHGIFSKGLKPLRDAGISRIFTHKGEVH